VFNLVKYRFYFVALSLLIIVPGVIGLILFGLNIGIDFTGGSSLTLRPQTNLSLTEAKSLLAPLNLKDPQITTGDLGSSDATQAGNRTVWIRLNTQVDDNVQTSIKSMLVQKYPGVDVSFETIPAVNGGKAFTLAIATKFASPPQVSDIQQALSKLPDTSNPNLQTTTSSSTGSTNNPIPPAATTTPTAKGTPNAKATATATASARATASSTPAAKATANATPATTTAPAASSTTNPANIPVNAVDISQGTTTKTINILTTTPLKSADVWAKIQPLFLSKGGPYLQLISSQEVGASVASDTTRNAFLAVVAASVFILLYIWFSFRKVAKPWRYGACAIIALLHDVLVVLGIFAFLGKFFAIQVDSLFITALLTVIGFSVHDTIVVFDRIRENMRRRTDETFEEVVNASLVQTMTRSLNTSLTVLFTLLALTLFTGTSSDIHSFTLTLLIGITSGTYSSIFNASMLLVMWEHGELGFGGRRDREGFAARRGQVRELARTR
jgi:preprotein translocase SecF subunit